MEKNYSQWLMLCTSWSISMLPNIWMIIRESPAPSHIPLNMIFITQTTLIPVYWKIHLASRLGATFSHWASLFLDKDDFDDVGLSVIYWF